MDTLEAPKSLHDRFHAEYQRATYRVDLPAGSQTIPLGARPGAWLESLLPKQALPREQPRWAFLTAWNPRSSPLPFQQNQIRQAELERSLSLVGMEFWPGWGIAPDPSQASAWFERCCLVIGITEQHAHAVARLWEQNAYVGPDSDGLATVIWV